MDALFPLSAGDQVDSQYLYQPGSHENMEPVLVHHGGIEHRFLFGWDVLLNA